MRKNFHIKPLTLCLILSFHLTAGAQKHCEACARRAMLVEFLNPHNPDYEKQLDAWQECTKKYLGDQAYLGPDTLDPAYKDAIMKCTYLDPPNKWYCYPSMMETYLGERLTNPCFHFLSPILYAPETDKPPEYIFKGSYEAGLEGGRIIEYFEDYKKPVIARMKCELYYNGNTPILVQEWFSENTINDPKALFNKLKMPKNITPVLEEFEKHPVKCEVKIPASEEICENGTAEIELSAFRDTKGNPSKSFNRIIVSIYKGEILNGENSDLGPDYKVFTIGEGSVKVQYRPPADKDDGWDWLRVYNSCEILPAEKAPMSGTLTDSMIVDQHFPFFCGFYKGTITITQSWDYADDYGNSFIGSKTVTCKGTYKPIEELRGREGQPFHLFGPSNVVATWEIKEDMYCGGDADCPGHCRQEFGQGTLAPDMWQELTIMTWVFPLEIKEVADQLGEIGMENYYVISVTPGLSDVITETREKGGDPCVWNVKQSEEDIPGAIIQYKLVDVDKLKGQRTWKSKHGATGYSIEITDMPDFQGEHVEPVKPVPDGTDFTYTVTWNLISL